MIPPCIKICLWAVGLLLAACLLQGCDLWGNSSEEKEDASSNETSGERCHISKNCKNGEYGLMMMCCPKEDDGEWIQSSTVSLSCSQDRFGALVKSSWQCQVCTSGWLHCQSPQSYAADPVRSFGSVGICGPKGMPDDSDCSEDQDCAGGLCIGSTGLSVAGPGFCVGKCKTRGSLPDGTKLELGFSTKYNSEQCASKARLCNICGNKDKGHKNPDGGQCSGDADCESGYCKARAEWKLWSECNGECVEKKEDGAMLQSTGLHLHWDPKDCLSGVQICGRCGATVPEGAQCSNDADCGPDLCCSGDFAEWMTVACQGTCVKQSPLACPSVTQSVIQTVEQGIDRVRGYAQDIAQCMKQSAVEKNEDISQSYFSTHFDLDALRASLEGNPPPFAQLSVGRRLSSIPENSPMWEEGETLKFPSGAFMKVNRIGRLKGTFGENLAGRKLQDGNKSGDSEGWRHAFSGNYSVPCQTSNVCHGGAAITGQAELEMVPKFKYDIDLLKQHIKIDMDVTVTTFVGMKALASGHCIYENSLLFPELPLPLLSACYATICISVWFQGRARFGLRGNIVALASAEHHMQYTLKGAGTISYAHAIKSKHDNPVKWFKSVLQNEWILDAKGYASAHVFAEVSPIISIIVTPGLWATIYPTFVASFSMFGTFHYQKNSSLDVPYSGKVPNPQIDCPTTEHLQKETNVTSSKDTDCFSSALSASGKMDIIAMGPIAGLSPDVAASMLEAVCSDLLQSLKDFSSSAVGEVSETAKQAVDCFYDKVLDPGTLHTQEAVCSAISTAFHTVSKLAIALVKDAQTYKCNDFYKESKGGAKSGCDVRVGCAAGMLAPLPLLPDGFYEWRDTEITSACSNVQPVQVATTLAACKGHVEALPECGKVISWNASDERCLCVLAGQVCDKLAGQVGRLHAKVWVGPRPDEVYNANNEEAMKFDATVPIMFRAEAETANAPSITPKAAALYVTLTLSGCCLLIGCLAGLAMFCRFFTNKSRRGGQNTYKWMPLRVAPEPDAL